MKKDMKGFGRDAQQKPIVSFRPTFRSNIILLVVFFSAGGYALYDAILTGGGTSTALALGIAFVAMIPPLKTVILNYYSIYPDRIGQRYGIISLKETEMPLERIITIEVKRTLMGRFLNYGTIEFSSAANNEPDIVFKNVLYPKVIESGIRDLQQQLGRKRSERESEAT